MIEFLVGLFIGTFIGITIMCILQVSKDNEELKADNYELNNRINDLLDNISIQKVKDKIEELEKWIYTGENAPQDFLQYRIKAKIQVLQELIEGRK